MVFTLAQQPTENNSYYGFVFVLFYFSFTNEPEEGSRNTLFAVTNPQLVEFCESLKAEDFQSAFANHDCRPGNPSIEVWEKTLGLIGLPSDAVERLIEGQELKCKYGASH
ncbi:hypothetical protein Pfo_010975 [Paulownia fortunei]|nr:hypothetical protein Pfo_010975 [Paulownia fortunei]